MCDCHPIGHHQRRDTPVHRDGRRCVRQCSAVFGNVQAGVRRRRRRRDDQNVTSRDGAASYYIPFHSFPLYGTPSHLHEHRGAGPDERDDEDIPVVTYRDTP